MKNISLILAATLLCVSFVSCGTDLPDQTVPSCESTAKETAANTVFASAAPAGYKIIRPDIVESESELRAAQLINNTLMAKYGPGIEFTTDFVRKSEKPDSVCETEILIGRTNRTASAAAYESLGSHEFTIQVKDSRLIVVGATPELTLIACEYLIENYMNEEGLILPGDFIEFYKNEPEYTYTSIKNPVAPSGADPWVILDEKTGKYYYCYSGGNGVCVNELESLDKITGAGGKKVYTAPAGTMYSKEYWAPELHKINGKWYIYVAADDGDNYNHRMYVLECTGDVPTDPFVMKGKITDSTDKWAIDGTVLQYDGECYFIWSGWEGDVNVAQNIYIAHMSDPWTIDSERVLLSKPDLAWEQQGGRPWINEGPVALVKDGTVHIIYSASGSWSDFYCLGKLTYRGGDILDPASWTKYEETVFEKTDKVFGPGHCSFTKAPDGSDWIVYHGNLVPGSGWDGRSVWIQPIDWDGDEPVLGTPLDPDTELKFPKTEYSPENIKKILKSE